jgi:hypothetical protein
MECLIHDLDEEAATNQEKNIHSDHPTTEKTYVKSTLSGDTIGDKAQTGMTGPSWTGGMGQGENKCRGGGPDHHPDELECDYCRNH